MMSKFDSPRWSTGRSRLDAPNQVCLQTGGEESQYGASLYTSNDRVHFSVVFFANQVNFLRTSFIVLSHPFYRHLPLWL